MRLQLRLFLSSPLKRGSKMKLFLCREGSEEFVVEAESFTQACEYAAMYNAVVVRELN